IDACLNLQRTVNESGFGKSIRPQGSVFLTVAAARHPADQVVPICRSERQYRNELQLRVTREAHQDKVWFDTLGTSLSLLSASLLCDGPDVFSVVEHLFIFDGLDGIIRG